MGSERIDLSNPDNFDRGVPHHWFKQLRSEDPVYWQDEAEGPGFWCLTKYEDLKHASTHPLEFSSAIGGTNIMDIGEEHIEMIRSMILNMDPPRHAKYRRIVARGFTPRQISSLRPRILKLARGVVDEVAAMGECEFVEDIACRLPMEVICELMGVPPNLRGLVYVLSNRLIGFDDPEFQGDMEDAARASAEMFAVAEEVRELKRRCPADDLTT